MTVVPAKAGTHIPESVVMGPRFRGDDRRECCVVAKIKKTRSHQDRDREET